MKITPFCSKEYAELIGTLRWTLTPSNVEIIDSIYFVKNGQFLTKKSFFSKTDGPIELKIGVQMRKMILEKWILKKGGPYNIHFFKEKCHVPLRSKENNVKKKRFGV